MGLKFAILYEGKTKKGNKMVKTIMDWPEDTVLKTLKHHFNKSKNIETAFKQTVSEFKKESIKLP
jgi:hypothetical protein